MILAHLLKNCPEELQEHQQQAIDEDNRQRCITARQSLKQVHNESNSTSAKQGRARKVAGVYNYLKGDA